MQKTEHFQLNQWEKTDRILMDDFNADNRKIDAALAAVAAVAGNCKVVSGTYTGTGSYNSASTAVKLTFEKKPFLLFIVGGSACACLMNSSFGFTFVGSSTVRDLYGYSSGNQYYWLSGSNAQMQMNSATIYTYYAFFM